MQCDSFCPITFSTAPTCFVCSFHGRCKKEVAPGATNTGDDKADTLPIVSASNDTKDFRRFQDERCKLDLLRAKGTLTDAEKRTLAVAESNRVAAANAKYDPHHIDYGWHWGE